jgi:glycerol uptake facilitator protein
LLGIGLSYGSNAGYAINPARDLGPRLLAYVAGWGNVVFTHRDYYFWVPIVGPLVGGVAGALVYDLLIARRHPPEE